MNTIKKILLRFKMGRAYASNDLKKAVAHAQKYLTLEKSENEGVLWLLLDCHFRMKAYEKAKTYAFRLLSVRPDQAEALIKLSQIFYKEKDYQQTYSFVCRALSNLNSSSDVDRLLNDLESNELSSGLVKNVRRALDEGRNENKEWYEWALKFKKWYEASA